MYQKKASRPEHTKPYYPTVTNRFSSLTNSHPEEEGLSVCTSDYETRSQKTGVIYKQMRYKETKKVTKPNTSSDNKHLLDQHKRITLMMTDAKLSGPEYMCLQIATERD